MTVSFMQCIYSTEVQYMLLIINSSSCKKTGATSWRHPIFKQTGSMTVSCSDRNSVHIIAYYIVPAEPQGSQIQMVIRCIAQTTR